MPFQSENLNSLGESPMTLCFIKLDGKIGID